MPPQIRLSPQTLDLLRCPACRARLNQGTEHFECTGPECAVRFPVIDGIPVLIDEKASVFSLEDFASRKTTYFGDIKGSKIKNFLRRFAPSISRNLKGKSNYARVGRMLLERSASPRVLVIGGSILGVGIKSLIANDAVHIVESDVSFGPRTALLCDAHDIPFEDVSFDGVIVQAVLEHVADPVRCCEENHRVLKTQGVVYAETPFMQQ
ncbi:MAG: methyltransferase domain-containing protein, partial [Alphaproteobacteria bacterium]|nr:methyltransferase domain-containing protein [Alphaproteobacteria bacterium]